MAPIAKTMSRARGWIWAHPRRARVAVAGAVVTALAGGAFIGLRPDGDADKGRLRHRQYAGSIGADGGVENDHVEAPSGSAAPDGAGSAGGRRPGGAGNGTGAPAASGAPTTVGTAPGASPGATAGSGPSPSTAGGTGGTDTTKPDTGATRTTGPGGGATSSPATTGANAEGWELIPKAPIGPRSWHSAQWTGREMVIWGGTADFEADPLIDGAAYDPAARTWRKLPAAPITPRHDARAFWTGSEMLVFGGSSVDGELADGAAWNPATNSWRAIPAAPTGPREGAVVAWAGDRLVIWSGYTVAPPDANEEFVPEAKEDGAAYVPATDSWVPIGPAPMPPRSGAQSAWTGSRLIVTGGEGEDGNRTDGAALDPVSGVWSPIAARPEPDACGGEIACTGIWTGTAVLFPSSAQAYDPAADRWSALAAPPGRDAPAPGEPAVWTGRWLLTWGLPGGEDDGSGADPGDTGDGPLKPVAAMYDPAANRWQPFPAGPLPSRTLHTAVWTGEAMLLWGGVDTGNDAFLADGAAYRPE
ncbi:MAG: hypothetical protein AB1679_13605 [Actinomycetota bacterium]|jgi:hypothetical protein